MLNKVLRNARRFAWKHNFRFKKHVFKKGDLWNSENEDQENRNWATFEKLPGVYVLADSKEILYIGMSGLNTGQRLFTHFTNEEKIKMFSVNTDIAVMSFSEHNRFMVTALESYLISCHKPTLNKRL